MRLRDEMHKRLMEWVNTNAAQDDFTVRAYVEVADLEETVDAQVTYLLAAVREALLSPEAVEAGALAAHRYGLVPEEVPDELVKEGSMWRRGRDRHYMPEARSALTAALDAAFGTEADDE